MNPSRCRKQANANLPNVEVYEFGTLVGHVCSKVSPNEAVPYGWVHLLEGFAN